MPNIGVALKDEINRLSRRVQKQGVAALQRASTTHRREIALLKRELAVLRRDVVRLQKGRPANAVASEAPASDTPTQRFQARGLKSLRARLDLSAAQFGKLVGVSGQTIYNWETEKATPRRAQLVALSAIRGIGKKEAHTRLA